MGEQNHSLSQYAIGAEPNQVGDIQVILNLDGGGQPSSLVAVKEQLPDK